MQIRYSREKLGSNPILRCGASGVEPVVWSQWCRASGVEPKLRAEEEPKSRAEEKHRLIID